MFRIPAKDADTHKAMMLLTPKVVSRISGDGLALIGASVGMGGLDIVRQNNGAWWVIALQVTFFLIVLGYIQARYNHVRLPETTLPDGSIQVHARWRPLLKSLAVSLICFGIAYFLAATVPQAIAAAECAPVRL